MKQKFKGEVLTTTKTVNKIIKMYNQSSNKEGLTWYTEAKEFAETMSMLFMYDNPTDFLADDDWDIKVTKVCGVIAALSPLKSWEENKKITISFLDKGISNHTKVMTNKAKAIMQSDGDISTISDILRGSKITSFFLNILDPVYNTGVTIDRHAVSLAVGRELQGDALQMSIKQYNFFVNAYRIASVKLGVKPLQVQAVTWVEWRKHKKRLREKE